MALFGLTPGSKPKAAPAAQTEEVFDAGMNDFEEKVMRASLKKPVLVDFWAPWCGPCKQLMPVLEQCVREAKGEVVLAKVNIDENPELAQMMRVQSVPTVLAFFQGQPVTGFTGVRPVSEIKNLISQLAALSRQQAPDALDIPAAIKGAATAMAEGDLATAQAIYAQVLSQDENHADAYGGLVRVFIAAGQVDQAKALVDGAPELIAKHPSFAAVKTALELAQAAPGGDVAALMKKVAANADDHAARFDLANAEFAAGRRAQAAEHLLEIIRRQRTWNEDAARVQLLKFLDAMGPADPLTGETRKKLSRLLFS